MTLPARDATENDYRQRILRVLVHIQKNLDQDLDLESLAQIAHFSAFHFHRVFRGMVGEGVKEHVRRLRLERAAHELRFSEEQVVRIALRAGYETHESFTRAFSAMFEESPSEFRKRRQIERLPDAAVHYAHDGNVVLENRKGRPMDVRIEARKPVRVAFVRHVGPYQNVGAAWGTLMQWAGRKGLFMRGPIQMLGLCHDDPDVTPADKLRYDACINVDPSVQADGAVGVQEIDAGEYATTVHVGPYTKLGDTYAELMGQWIPKSGRKLGAPPSIEEYLNDPRTTPEEQLQTKVWVRLV